MIIDEIKKANINAMKERNTVARNIFSVVMNKVMLEQIKRRESGVELTDADVANILNKTIKELTDEKSGYEKVGNTERVDYINQQSEIISKFLPKLLSESEITEIIKNMEDKSIGSVMKKFKTEYNGKCDMKTVSEVLKRFN